MRDFVSVFAVFSVFLLASLAVTPLRASASDANLVGYWSLDSSDINWDTGVITDLSGNGNNGTVHNLTSAAQVTGQVGGALQFNDTSAYISVPATDSFPPTGDTPRTVCMWLKPTLNSWTPDINSLFEYGNSGTRGAYGIDMDNFPDMQFYTWGDDLLVAMGISGHETDWLQVCYVYDGDKTLSLYSNGVLRGTHALGGRLNTASTTVNIGRSSLVSNAYFDGIIDEVRIYDAGFTGDQIQSLYDDATNPATPSSIASTTGETTATVSWNTSTSSDSRVWYGTSSGTYTTSTSSPTLVTSHSIGLTGLTSLTTYYFVVVSNDGSGDVATSSEATLRTVDLTPPTLSSIAASPTASTSPISWTTNEAGSTKVVYSPDTSYASSTGETNTGPRVTSHSASLASLASCTLYHYKVVSADASENYATSSASTFTTTGCPGGATPSSTTSTVVTVAAAATSTVSDAGRTFTVATPANVTATSSSLVIQIKGMSADTVLGSIGKPSSLSSAASLVFDVTALIDGSIVLDSFDHSVTITYHYTDSDVSGLDESSLTMYHYHDGAWLPLDDCSVDASANTITCSTPSFSTFALFGTPVKSSSVATVAGSILPGYTERNPLPGEVVVATAAPTAPAGNQGSAPGASCAPPSFARDLHFGEQGADVRALQQYLNCAGFALGESGPGAPGQETIYFVDRTKAALIRFQEAHAAQILTPLRLARGTGYLGSSTRAFIAGGAQ